MSKNMFGTDNFCILICSFFTICFSFSAVPISAHAQAYMNLCASALRPNIIEFQNNKYAQAALLSTLTSSSSSHNNANGSLDIPDFFKGNYGSEQNASQALATYMNSNWTTDDYTGYVAAYIPHDGYATYDDCVKNALSAEGIRLEVQSADENSATIVVHFNPPTGAQGKLGAYHLQIVTDGHPFNKIPAKSYGYTKLVRIIKKDPSRSLHVVANVDGPTNPPGDSLTIPPYVRTSSSLDYKTVIILEPVTQECGGGNKYDSHPGASFGTEPIPLGSDDTFDVDTAQAKAVTFTSWNGPGPDEPTWQWDTKTEKLLLGHTICSVGAGKGDNHFFIRHQIIAIRNVHTYTTITPQASSTQLSEEYITQ